jgi:hypothetical protein
MPFQSKAQQGFLYAHPEKVGGKKKLAEWSAATDFKHLPEKKASGLGRKKPRNSDSDYA